MFTNAAFLQEWKDFILEARFLSRKVIILGDFNVHTNKVQHTDSIKVFVADAACGFEQLVVGSTHTDGHTLDMLFYKPEKVLCHNAMYMKCRCLITI